MTKISALLTFGAISLGGSMGLAASGGAPTFDLTVQLKGVENRSGTLRCSLFDQEAGFPMDTARAVATTEGSVKDGQPICVFTLSRAGDYAVAVGHDENGNRKVDTNFLGIPKEGWATSNNVKPALRAPTFKESRVRVPAAATTIAVVMHY